MSETLLGGKPNSDTAPPKKDDAPPPPPPKKEDPPPPDPAKKDPPKGDEPPAKTPEQLATEAAAAEKTKIDTAVAEALKPYAAPEKYTLQIEEGGPLTADDLDEFAAEAKTLGLTQKQAQQLVEQRVKLVTTTAARYLDDVKADPELGGAKLKDSIGLAIKGRDYLFPPGTAGAEIVNTWFEKTGLGNHKELMRAFVRLGKALAEDSPALGAEGGKVPVAQRDHASVLYDKSKK